MVNLMEFAAENSVKNSAQGRDGEALVVDSSAKRRQQKRNFRLRNEDSVQSDCLPDESTLNGMPSARVESTDNFAVRGCDLKLGRSVHRDSAYSSCNDMHDANDDMFSLSSYEQLVANCKHLVQLHSPSPSSASSASSDNSLLGKSFTVNEELNLGLSADEVNRTLAANLNGSASESIHVVNGTEFDSAAEDELLGLLHVEEQREPDANETEMFLDRSTLNTPLFSLKHSDAFISVEKIRDFSPDWCYQGGGTKLLITGDWSDAFSYVVIFDQSTYVPAQLVQPGVLKAFCPPHAPGKASLAVKCLNTGQLSPPVKFEYRPAPLSLGPNGCNNETSMFMINNGELVVY